MIFFTDNCIKCLKPATIHGGHVVCRYYDFANGDGTEEEDKIPIHIIAGFCSNCSHDEGSDDNGCFGKWKPEYGVHVPPHHQKRKQ